MYNEHAAFDDACTCLDLLSAFVDQYHIKRYTVTDNCKIIPFMSSSEYRRKINQLYGVISGIEIDNKIYDKEYDYLLSWWNNHSAYQHIKSVKHIFNVIDLIIEEEIVTIDELNLLNNVIVEYLQ
ncbi:MAG: hypothetical protein RSC93_10210 [Erysipelotrichaceae bacterium]